MTISTAKRRTRASALGAIFLVAVAACGSSSGSTGASGSATPSATAASNPTTPTNATATVEHVQLPLVDKSRPAVDPSGIRSAPVRALPTELYLPATSRPRPLIVFAHGFDGDPSKFTELLTHWADAGFVVAAPKFPVTQTGSAAQGIALAADSVQQPADMSFVLDSLLKGKFASRIDAKHIGAAGLSLGGGTTWGLIAHSCCRDRRITAAIVMDGLQFPFPGGSYGKNRVPLLMFHADHDYALPYGAARGAYAGAAAPKWFVTLVGFTHAEPFENTPALTDAVVLQTSTDYWRAQLNGDQSAARRVVPDATVAGLSSIEATIR